MVGIPAAISMLIPWNTAAFLTAALKYFSANPWFFSVLQSWLCQWRCQKVFFMLLFIMKRTPYKRTCKTIKISLYICLNVNLSKEKNLKITFFIYFLVLVDHRLTLRLQYVYPKCNCHYEIIILVSWNYVNQYLFSWIRYVWWSVSTTNVFHSEKHTSSFFNAIFRPFNSLNVNKECFYYDVIQVYLNLYLKSNMMSKIYSKH